MSLDSGAMDEFMAGITALLYTIAAFMGLLLLIVVVLVFRGLPSVRLGDRLPGAFDDSEQFFEEEATAVELMDDRSRQSYLMAKRWVEHNPPNSADTNISLSQYMTIQEKAVAAWEFTSDYIQQPTVNIHNRTEIDFRASADMCCVQTNLPLPKQKEVYYWETKIYDMAPDTKLAVGLTTKPYPGFRLPGMHRYSVSYESQGIYRLNQPFSGISYGRQWQRGDVIGVGFRSRTGTVFFTHNGRKLDDVAHGMRVNLFPTVGGQGAANLYVNLGQDGFVFIQANVKEWGLAPAQGSLAPPPAYGDQDDSLLLESTARNNHTASAAAGTTAAAPGPSTYAGGVDTSRTPPIQRPEDANPAPTYPESEAPPYVQRRSSDQAHLSLHSEEIRTPPGSPPLESPAETSETDDNVPESTPIARDLPSSTSTIPAPADGPNADGPNASQSDIGTGADDTPSETESSK